MTSISPNTSTRPHVLAVDDDEIVLDAVAADLRDRYGDRYRVHAASSGHDALDLLRALRLRDEAVALLVVDQRMPRMSGTEFLIDAQDLYPSARTILLTAYADTDAAITAINEIRLDHYVLKPWDPPEERLFPVVDELLEEWAATRPERDVGVRLVGERWSATSHRLRDYLARNLVPYRWVDITNPDAGPLLAAASEGSSLPLLVLEDGTTLAAPTLDEVAAACRISSTVDVDFHDVVVVGAGPAGLAAAVYGGSEGLRTALVEAEAPGGQAGLSSRIENYLGFPSGISGAELTRRAFAQARRFGTTLVAPRQAVRIERADPYRVVTLDNGAKLHCWAVVIATGVQYRRLEADGIDDLVGAGVYYGAASTEAASMVGGRAIVVGGANSAGQAALHLERYADEVVVVIRGGSLNERMSSYLVERIDTSPTIRVLCGTRIGRVEGDGRLEQVTLIGPDGEQTVEAAGMFVFVGAQPRTDWLRGDVARDDHGFVLAGALLPGDRWSLDRDPYPLETSIPGVFAVGDVRATSIKRIASAVGEGSVAIQRVHQVIAGAS